MNCSHCFALSEHAAECRRQPKPAGRFVSLGYCRDLCTVKDGAKPHGRAGTELKRLLAKFGIEQSGCHCTARQRTMDLRGPDWCEQNIETIVGWLREEAQKRKLPFVDAAARVLVRLAIRRARNKS